MFCFTEKIDDDIDDPISNNYPCFPLPIDRIMILSRVPSTSDHRQQQPLMHVLLSIRYDRVAASVFASRLASLL